MRCDATREKEDGELSARGRKVVWYDTYRISAIEAHLSSQLVSTPHPIIYPYHRVQTNSSRVSCTALCTLPYFPPFFLPAYNNEFPTLHP